MSEGNVNNVLIRLNDVVWYALKMGMSVDLAELGSLRFIVPSKMLYCSEEVTMADTFKTLKIFFIPKLGTRLPTKWS